MLQHIWALEGEREARGQEATEAAQRHAQALEQVKLRDMAAADLQKKVPSTALKPFACLKFQGMSFACMHDDPAHIVRMPATLAACLLVNLLVYMWVCLSAL